MTRGDHLSGGTGRTEWGTKLRIAAMIVLALCLALGLMVGASDAKKKKKKGGNVFQATQAVNVAIPEDATTGPSVPVTSTITVGKKFKGKTIGDVNVTGITTLGSNVGAANDLDMTVSAPDGTTIQLLNNQNPSTYASLGPLTLDDDSRTSTCQVQPPSGCADPDATLYAPFAGTANLLFMGTGDTGPLSNMNGGPMRGTYTAKIWDSSTGGNTTSIFSSWGLKITAERAGT